MNYFIAIAYFLLASATMTFLTKKKFGFSLSMTLITCIFPLLFSTLIFKTFAIGFIINIAFALFIFILAVISRKDKKRIKEFKENYFTKGLIAFVVISLIVFAYDYGRTFSGWDEFSHWGVMIKEMFRLDSLYSTSSSTLLVHKDYPPAFQLYEFFFLKLCNGYSEELLIKSVHLFEISLFIPAICESINKKRKIVQTYIESFVLGISAILLILLFDCHTIINTIYTDYAMAILVGYILYTIINEKDKTKTDYIIFLCSSLSFLLLTKQMGLPLYLMCIFLYLLSIIKWPIKKKNIDYQKCILIAILIVVVPLSLWKSWDIYVTDIGVTRQFKLSDINLSDFIGIVNGSSGEDWQRTTLKNYISGISTIPNTTSYISLNYYQLFALGVLLLYLLYLFSKNTINNKTFKLIVLTITIGFIGYAFTMLILYIYSFGPGEGPILASFNRYMPTYILIVYSLLLMLFVWIIRSKKKYNYLYILFVVLLVIQSPAILDRLSPINKTKNMTAYQEHADIIKEDTTDNDKVYVIAQNSIGDYQYFIKYYADGIIINTFNYSLETENSQKYFQDNIYEYMKDFDYVYLAIIDEAFIDNYSFLFSKKNIQEKHLYKIINKGDSIKLEIVED